MASGSVYALAGCGLVLTYKTSGIFNFAHGAMATISAYLFYTLHQQHHVAWGLSAAICVLGLGLGMGLLFELFARRLVLTSVAQRIAGTVGAMILVQAGATLIYSVNLIQVKPFLPNGQFELGGVYVGWDQVTVVVVGLVVTAALYLFLRYSRRGTAMRAVVDNPDLLRLSQYNPNSIRRTAWIIGCVLATLSGVLLVPFVTLSPNQLTLLVVQAFGAAAIGGFGNLPLTYLGGLIIGVGSSLATHWVGNIQILSGLPSSIPFIVLFVVLIVARRGRLRLLSDAGAALTRFHIPAPRLSGTGQALWSVPPLALAAVAPLFLKSHVLVWGDGLTFVILFASMALLVRVAGQVSLCHVAFAAIGASTFARLAGNDHFPWLLALLFAALVVVPIGAFLAIPASRLPVLYLGLATFGFGLVVQQMFYGTNLMFSPFAEGLNVQRPTIAGYSFATDTRYYYLILAFTVVSLAIIMVLVNTRLGRVLTGLSDSPRALNALGSDERVTRVLVFCISAFFAGLAGALYAGLLGNVSDVTFDPLASLTYLVLIVIAIGNPLWAAIAGAIGIAIIPGYVESGNISQYLQLAFGVMAVLVSAGPGHPKVPAFLEPLFSRFSSKPTAALTPRGSAGGPAAQEAARDLRGEGTDLEIRGVSVSFGGLRAVDNVSLVARPGMITGLIGPNGAGKTTTFNVCSGLQPPTGGRVLLDGQDVTGWGPARRARLGLGRTFQRPELFSSMTVLDNVELGREASIAGASPWSQVVSRASERRLCAAAAEQSVELCHLEDLLPASASTLTTGQRRMVEIARCIAGPVRLLLLDEPSAGLDPSETEQLGEILRELRDQGLGILLVEHDMDLVMDICDHIYVLDFGKLIFEGDPAAVQGSELVQAAYLGDTVVEDLEGSSR